MGHYDQYNELDLDRKGIMPRRPTLEEEIRGSISVKIDDQGNQISENQYVDNTLAARGSRYGKFNGVAQITQALKAEMRATPNWDSLSFDKKEALEMIAQKIARILNGDPSYHDSWHDIAGYAELVASALQGVQK